MDTLTTVTTLTQVATGQPSIMGSIAAIGPFNYFIAFIAFVIHILMKLTKARTEQKLNFHFVNWLQEMSIPSITGLLSGFIMLICAKYSATIISEGMFTWIAAFIGYSNSSVWYNFIKTGSNIYGKKTGVEGSVQ